MSVTLRHSHCRHFAPVDVAKGICLLSERPVMIDTPPCPQFQRAPSCGICRRFRPPAEGRLGRCEGFADQAWTWPDLSAVHCERFQPALPDREQETTA